MTRVTTKLRVWKVWRAILAESSLTWQLPHTDYHRNHRHTDSHKNTELFFMVTKKLAAALINWWQLNFCFCNFNYRNISQTIWRNPSLRLDKYIWPLWPGKPSGDQVSIEYRVGGSANPGPAPRPHLTCWQLGDILAATAIDRFLLDLPSWELWVLTQSNLLLESI